MKAKIKTSDYLVATDKPHLIKSDEGEHWSIVDSVGLTDVLKSFTSMQMYIVKDNGGIIAAFPAFDKVLPVSKETVQQWIDCGCPSECDVEMEPCCEIECTGRCQIVSPSLSPQTDPNGCIVLTFEKKHTIYTHPEENAGRLDNISALLDKLIELVTEKSKK